MPFARKRFGQHFLERAWVDKLIQAIAPSRRPDPSSKSVSGRGAPDRTAGGARRTRRRVRDRPRSRGRVAPGDGVARDEGVLRRTRPGIPPSSSRESAGPARKPAARSRSISNATTCAARSASGPVSAPRPEPISRKVLVAAEGANSPLNQLVDPAPLEKVLAEALPGEWHRSNG